jgi:hypothetical protein
MGSSSSVAPPQTAAGNAELRSTLHEPPSPESTTMALPIMHLSPALAMTQAEEV